MTYSGRVNGINGQVLLKDEWVVEGNDGVPPIPKDVEGYTFAGWDDSYIAIKKDKDINTRYVKRQSDVKKERLEELRRSLLKLNLPKSVEVELMNLAEVLIEEEENGQNARSLALSFAVLMYIGALVSASAWAIFTADDEMRISWQDIEDAFQSCFVNPALIITIFAKAKADTEEKVAELESGDEGSAEDNSNNMGNPNNNPNPAVMAGLIAKISDYLKDKVGTCDGFAKALVEKLNQAGISFEIIRIDTKAGFIYSDKFGDFIGKSYHYGIRVGNMVYDNLTLKGSRCEEWLYDLGADGSFADISWRIVTEIINH